jgi:hypothetical protein
MKKVFTLMLALGSLTAVFAQGGYSNQRSESRDAVLGRPSTIYNSNDHRNDYGFTSRERDQQIKEINRDFDKQIKAVKKTRSFRPYEKERRIRILEAQRTQKIQKVNARFNSQYNREYRNRGNKRW